MMARTKTQSDADLVAHLLAILAEHGEKGLTFGVLSQRCGLAPATLAQRFGSVEAMVRRAILSEWDRLSLAVSELEAEAHISSKGAQALLKSIPPPSPHVLALSLRDPDLRTAAEAWRGQVEAALAARRGGGSRGRDAAAMIFAAWQGRCLWDAAGGKGFRLSELLKALP
jgi:AcrR family transcriptional regulator